MSTETNVQMVKDFFAAMGSYDSEDLLARLPTISRGSFRARAGRWLARTAGTPNWPPCFRRRRTR